MNCRREDELLDALHRGYIDPDLTAHVECCSPCTELRLVAGALLEDRAEAMISAPVPSAGAMWLRMQMRQRQELQVRARRTLLIGQAATLVIALAVVLAVFGGSAVMDIRDAASFVRQSTPLLLTIAACTLLAPIAGWIAVRQK